MLQSSEILACQSDTLKCPTLDTVLPKAFSQNTHGHSGL
ncbi:hypothetical protein DSUL_100161 [Desulfovibrionales bacterium]